MEDKVLRPGTLLGIKPEWRDPGETDDTHYILIENNGDRYLIMFVDKDNHFEFPLYNTVPAECVYPIVDKTTAPIEEPEVVPEDDAAVRAPDVIATEAPTDAITPPHLRDEE